MKRQAIRWAFGLVLGLGFGVLGCDDAAEAGGDTVATGTETVGGDAPVAGDTVDSGETGETGAVAETGVDALGEVEVGETEVPPARTELPADLLAFRDTLTRDAAAFARVGGAWTEDQGDAAFYGTALYTRLAVGGTGPEGAAAIGDAAFLYNVGVLKRALDDVPWLLDNLEECMMSALGVAEVLGTRADADGLAALDAFVDLLDSMLAGFGDYLEVDVNSWALKTYGPTAITGAVALVHVQYALLIGGERGAERLARARAMLAKVDEKAWNGTYYKFASTEDRLDLYPNVMMALVLGRLYQADHQAADKARSEALFTAIQPLKLPAGNYYSEYSAVLMGAKTKDYSTLSSQNYLGMALAVLYENALADGTAADAQPYLSELVALLRWVQTHLYDATQGRVLHHWIDGEIARPTDPEVFCSGCNLQLLYLFWFIARER